MHRVIYRSQALVGEYTPAALEILSVAERRNRMEGITGYLHREMASFIQIIEGHPLAIGRLLGRLANDSRHTGIQILSDQAIEERAFDAWDMGYLSNHHYSLRHAVPEIWMASEMSDAAVDRTIMFFRDLAALKQHAA